MPPTGGLVRIPAGLIYQIQANQRRDCLSLLTCPWKLPAGENLPRGIHIIRTSQGRLQEA